MKKFITLIIILILFFSLKPQNNVYTGTAHTPLFNAVRNYYSKSDSTLRLMTYNLLSHEMGFDGISTTERKADTITLINTVNPDILALQEMSFDIYRLLESKTGLSFTDPLPFLLSRTMTTLMYNPERLTLLDCGTVSYHFSTNPRLRCYTWGLFKNKKSGMSFLAINTHLNLYEQATAYPLLQATELMDFCKQAQSNFNCSVYILGDLNSPKNSSGTHSAVYDYISLFYYDSLLSADKKTQGADKSLTLPTNDYIFCSDNENIISYNLLSQPELNMLSDHYPLFIDVKS